jgi:hypothetical protein
MTFTNKDEIKVIEDWRFVFWDLKNDVEFTGAITGTPWQPIPPVEKRLIQNVYGKIVHVPDDGELELVFDGDASCNPYQVRMRCKTCGKTFCADV